jgi:hypothetical protein
MFPIDDSEYLTPSNQSIIWRDPLSFTIKEYVVFFNKQSSGRCMAGYKDVLLWSDVWQLVLVICGRDIADGIKPTP